MFRIVIICPWGDQGASYSIAGDGKVGHVKAIVPEEKIVDSLGKIIKHPEYPGLELVMFDV